MVADEFEGVAAFDQADALIDQALELDRLDLGAVLLGLAAALRLLVAVELALDAVELAVEQVDERPQEIGEIVLEAGAGQHGAEGFDYLVELGLHGIGFGQGARIGFVLAGAIAVEGELVEQMRGRRGGGKFGIGVAVPRIKSGDRLKGRGLSLRAMAGAFLPEGQPRRSRPSRRSLGRRRRRVAPPGSRATCRVGWALGAGAQRRMAPGSYFASRCKAALSGGGGK